jgi:broad specificity phosphatase PhoE
VPLAYYISHPQVVQDPAIPVPRWTLSAIGHARLATLADKPWVQSLTGIWSSAEQKAIDTADTLAAFARCRVVIDERMHENDRSATGFLPPSEFERTADTFFAFPVESVRGWERAIDAQTRIARAIDEALAQHSQTSGGPIAFSGHGGVGTLLFCHLAGEPIQRARDQPAGGGNAFAFEIKTRKPIFAWRAIEDIGP